MTPYSNKFNGVDFNFVSRLFLQEHADEDKFLYIAYSDESVYGSSN